MNTLTKILSALRREPVRANVYAALAAILVLLPAFGVDLTEPRTAASVTFIYAVLGLVTERARGKVSPV